MIKCLTVRSKSTNALNEVRSDPSSCLRSSLRSCSREDCEEVEQWLENLVPCDNRSPCCHVFLLYFFVISDSGLEVAEFAIGAFCVTAHLRDCGHDLVHSDSVWGLDQGLVFSVSCLWFGRLISFQTHRSSAGFTLRFRHIGLTK